MPPRFDSRPIGHVTSWLGNTYPGTEKWVQQDIRECLVAHRRADGEFVVFLEDDYKSKVVMYRIKPGDIVSRVLPTCEPPPADAFCSSDGRP